MSAEHFIEPDALPAFSPARKIGRRRIRDNWVDLRLENTITQDYTTQNRSMVDAMGRRLTRLISPSHHKRSASVFMPVGIEAEPIEDIAKAAHSIGVASEAVDCPVETVPWFNFEADPRREQSKIKKVHQQIELAKTALQDCLTGKNTALTIGIDHLPYGTTIATIRQRMFLAKLSLIDHLSLYPSTPYVSVDVDTTIGANALQEITTSLYNREALFVNGHLRYTGGIMDTPERELKELDDEFKLLYLAEHMRRHMYNNLPEAAIRGYLPETGFATRPSTLAGLGGYVTEAQDNETYWLEVLAARAVESSKKYLEIANTRRSAPLVDPISTNEAYITPGLAESIESITRYKSYDVDTSIKGIMALVRKFGAAAAIGFDTGHHYVMRTKMPKEGHLREPQRLTVPQMRHLLDSVYSFYKDCGGVLSAESLVTLNELIRNIINFNNDELVPGELAWAPKYVSKEQRPKVEI